MKSWLHKEKKIKQASIDDFNLWYDAGNSKVHFMFVHSVKWLVKKIIIIKDWKYPLISKGLNVLITQHGWPNLDLILTAVLTAPLSTSIPSISHKISSLVSNIAVLFSSVLKFGFCHFLTFCSLYNRVELGWVETWMPGTCISYRELVVLSFLRWWIKNQQSTQQGPIHRHFKYHLYCSLLWMRAYTA